MSKHIIKIHDAREQFVDNYSIDLIITSPPYPMIKMWDSQFKQMNRAIDADKSPQEAFNLMHDELIKVYYNCFQALRNGGILIINIGDAVRRIRGKFQKFSNAARTIELCEQLGFTSLPQIFWYKPTNSPNKFLGSGMLPVNAYVALEVEHVLNF